MKHYSNRYVGKQSSKKHDYSKLTNNGKFVEFLACLLIGAIATYALTLMSITFYKFTVSAKAKMDLQQHCQIDYYDSILSD